MLKAGVAAAVAVALCVVPAADAKKRAAKGKPSGSSSAVVFTAPYGWADGYGGCAKQPPAGVCEWTGTGTTAGLLGGSSSWDSGTAMPGPAGNAYGAGVLQETYSVGRNVKTLTLKAEYTVTEALSASGSLTGFGVIDGFLEVYPPGCRSSDCDLEYRTTLADDYVMEDPPATLAEGTTFTLTSTFSAPGGTFKQGTALLRTAIVTFAGGSMGPDGTQYPLATGEASGVARLDRLTVTPAS